MAQKIIQDVFTFCAPMINMRATKRRHLVPASVAIKRVVVDFPTPLLNRAERVVTELATNRSELIRRAVEQYLETLQQAKLERDLADGYTANAQQARHACEEFAYSDSDIS